MSTDIYEVCPTLETKSFYLRLVRKEDAMDLLTCYSDKAAVARVNADRCTSDFYYTSLKQMEDCIDGWLFSYQNRWFVRMAIVEKSSDKAVGTTELFGGTYGVLRIDLARAYDKECYIEELLQAALFGMLPLIDMDYLEILTENTPDRIPLYERYGFVPTTTFRADKGYYERARKHHWNPEKGLAFCGLACCVCGENEACAGCRMDGCRDKEWCKSFQCCKEKKLSGCWECTEFACENPMLEKPRVHAFASFIQTYGEEALMKALHAYEKAGIRYHYEGQIVGDYDHLSTEEEVIEVLRHMI